ncbi:hypothetical protein NC651_019906 [Populus alba x Populus x berolinensis]|nr:hypothetical protein NC651_019902 [Populus alba x Populus x berolinensis]KAJ6902265.1 hypothetical protein NC651_019906 [Populus alba x Populus x berolinensis]
MAHSAKTTPNLGASFSTSAIRATYSYQFYDSQPRLLTPLFPIQPASHEVIFHSSLASNRLFFFLYQMFVINFSIFHDFSLCLVSVQREEAYM